MKFLLSFWPEILAALVALGGLLFGKVKAVQADNAKRDKEIAERTAVIAVKRSKEAEEITDYLVKRSDQSRKEVETAVKTSKTRRRHFSD